MNPWLVDTWSDVWHIPVSAIAMLAVVILAVRLVGLRSFSKMSSFDFAVTVSIGSILGGVVASNSPILEGAIAVISLLVTQGGVSWVRARRSTVATVLDNSPVLLMSGPDFIESNMLATRVTHADVIAKLREANVLRMQDIRAVILETTGDISVLHGDHDVDPEILTGVRRDHTAG